MMEAILRGPRHVPGTFAGAVLAAAASVSAVLIGASGLNAQVAQATPDVFYACYVPASGTVYRIKEPSAPQRCQGSSHIEFSWTDGRGALRIGDAPGGDLGGTYPDPTVVGLQGRSLSSAAPEDGQVLAWRAGAWQPRTLSSVIEAHGDLTGLDNDDHPHYLMADGTRGLTGNWNVGNFQIAGLAEATAPGEAVRFEQAVKHGDMAGGDLGGTYPNPQVRIQGRPISADAPQVGQVLAYDGIQWTARTPAGGVSTHGELTDLDVDDHPQYLLTNGVRISTGGFAVNGALGSGGIPSEGPGVRLMWYPGKAAFRAGSAVDEWDDANVGEGSVAMGFRTTASGAQSVSLGAITIASGLHSTAVGFDARASARESVGIGSGARANGAASMALGVGGNLTTANGAGSLAAGLHAVAGAPHSTVIGSYATSLADHQGSFVYGDRSTSTPVTTTAANQFVVRAAGGFHFRTAADLSTGCNLPSGSGSWNCTSSRHAKTDFQDVDAEGVLEKIARMSIQSWSYINQGLDVRHLGPTAQDFHSAFGLGTTDEAISLVDADGINMLAIQALIERTNVLQDGADRVQALETRVRQLEERLAVLEAHLLVHSGK